jgi:hypothetical protein
MAVDTRSPGIFPGRHRIPYYRLIRENSVTLVLLSAAGIAVSRHFRFKIYRD